MSLAVTLLLGPALALAPLYAAIPDDPAPVWSSWLCAGTLAAAALAAVAAGRGDRAFLLRLSRAERAFLALLGLAFLSIPVRMLVQHGTGYFGPMLRGWALLASSFAAFALARRLAGSPQSLYGLAFAAVAVAVVVADIGVQEYVTHVRAGDAGARTFATSTPDYLAGYFVLTIPVTLALFLEAPAAPKLTPLLRGLVTLVLGVALLFQLGTLLTTGSRFALVSLTAALVVFAAALLRARRTGLVLARASRWLLLALAAGVLAGGLVFARPVLGRLHTLNDNSAAFRVWTWKGAARMAVSNPLLGTGIGTWESLYPPYAYTGFTRAAHNSYLQLADECGIPALGALLAALGFLGASLGRGLATAPQPRRLLLCGLMAALAGGVVQNLIDSDWYAFFLGLTFWTLAGLAAGLAAPGDAQGIKDVAGATQARPPALAFGLVAAAFAAYTAAQAVAVTYGNRAQAQMDADPAGAGQTYDAARAWDPLNGRYPSDQGYKVFYNKMGRLSEAETAVRTAVALEPNAVNYRHLGTILQAFGRQDEALAAYDAGLRADPHFLDLLLDAARLAPPPRAIEYYRRISALELTPVGTVRALGDYTETNFAVADAVMGDEAAKTDAARAAALYARAARGLEEYADRGGSLNYQQRIASKNRPNPHKDAALRALYGHVLTVWIALATPEQRAALRARQKKYGQIYDRVCEQSSKPGIL